MNPYLTQKSVKSNTWRIVTASLCLFFAVIAFTTMLDFIQQKNWGTVCADLAMIAALLIPAYRNIRHIVRSNDARQIARHLAQRTEERVSLESFMRDAGKPCLAKHLGRLIEGGFLQNIRIDAQTRTIVLTAPNQRLIDNDIMEMECPSCGAKNQVTRGRVGRCAYCEQTLIPGADQRKKDRR